MPSLEHSSEGHRNRPCAWEQRVWVISPERLPAPKEALCRITLSTCGAVPRGWARGLWWAGRSWPGHWATQSHAATLVWWSARLAGRFSSCVVHSATAIAASAHRFAQWLAKNMQTHPSRQHQAYTHTQAKLRQRKPACQAVIWCIRSGSIDLLLDVWPSTSSINVVRSFDSG